MCFFFLAIYAPINLKPAGGGKAWGGDLTFFKNLPSNSLPTGKPFQSNAQKLPHPGRHIAVKYRQAGRKKATSFPGSLLFTPQEAREGRPWLGLVTCLLKYGRLQISDWREGLLSVSLPILRVPGMGKHAPARINLQNRACFKGNQRANL